MAHRNAHRGSDGASIPSPPPPSPSRPPGRLARRVAVGVVVAALVAFAGLGVASLVGPGTPHHPPGARPAPGGGHGGGGTNPAPGPPPTPAVAGSLAPAPRRPPVHVCGNTRLLRGPARRPAGAVVVAAGTDPATLGRPHTTYWFAPGVHTLPSARYSAFRPAAGDTYLGAPGAVLDGQGLHPSAIAGTAPDVTVAYLTIEHFAPPGQEAAVNQGGQPGWSIHNVSIVDNTPGAGAMLGSHDVLSWSCLADNGQYGFQAFSTFDRSPLTGGPQDVTVDHDEIAGNDTYGWEIRDPGCGCSGGAKFWRVDGATIEDNYIHGNRWVGLWADTDNTGFRITGNYIAGNQRSGITYEISYNAVIDSNTLVRNGIVDGSQDQTWMPAIYISESGGSARVPGRYRGIFDIEGNVLIDNWGGVVLWENSNRFCGGRYDNVCTLVDPAVYTLASCRRHLPTARPGQTPDYFANCRWRTQNVLVARNSFQLSPQQVGSGCSQASKCGINGVFSEFGTVAPYRGWVVPEDISARQDNHFLDNRYRGPWLFDGLALGDFQSWHGSRGGWSTGFTAHQAGGLVFPAQDRGSSYAS